MSRYWMALAWLSYIVAVGWYRMTHDDTASATYMMALGCFFLLMAIWEQRQPTDGRGQS